MPSPVSVFDVNVKLSLLSSLNPLKILLYISILNWNTDFRYITWVVLFLTSPLGHAVNRHFQRVDSTVSPPPSLLERHKTQAIHNPYWSWNSPAVGNTAKTSAFKYGGLTLLSIPQCNEPDVTKLGLSRNFRGIKCGLSSFPHMHMHMIAYDVVYYRLEDICSPHVWRKN